MVNAFLRECQFSRHCPPWRTVIGCHRFAGLWLVSWGAVRVHCTRGALVQCTLTARGRQGTLYQGTPGTLSGAPRYNAGGARFDCPDCKQTIGARKWNENSPNWNIVLHHLVIWIMCESICIHMGAPTGSTVPLTFKLLPKIYIWFCNGASVVNMLLLFLSDVLFHRFSISLVI